MMQPRVKLKIKEVSLFESRCELKFLLIKIFIDLFSKVSKVLTITISNSLCKFKEIKASPRIMPTKSKKKISSKSPKSKLRTANGNKKYIETPAATEINPKSKYGIFV